MTIWRVISRKRIVLPVTVILLISLNSLAYGGWDPVPLPSVSADWWLYGVRFTSSTEGWAVGRNFVDLDRQGVLLHCSGGAWTNVAPPPVSLDWGLNGDVNFISPDEGWAVGSDNTNRKGVLLHYSGGTWVSETLPAVSSNWRLYGVHFSSSGEGWAVGSDNANRVGVLLHYSGGAWTSATPPAVSPDWLLSKVHFTSADEGWAVGSDNTNQMGVLLHYSGGAWTNVAPPSMSSNWYLAWIHFTSSSEGWAVGGDETNHRGVLLHYSGGTWTSVPPPSVSSDWALNGEVYFLTPDEGWAVGESYADPQHGITLHYSKGTWTSVSVPSLDVLWWLNGVHFVSPDEGWAVGGGPRWGIMLRYSPISPDQGTIGTEFIIPGPGFGARRGKVLLGTVALKTTQWSNDSIQCQLTRPLSPGTYDVTIMPQARGSSSITFSNGFTVKAPEVDSVNPANGSTGDEITMSGLFFGAKRGKVKLGGKTCRVLSWTMDPTTGASEVRFVVPRGLSPGINELRLTNSVGSGTTDFTVQ